jgi:LPS-assembly lipoprotein
MWSPDRRLVMRSLAACSLAGLTAGCFQPLYGDPNVVPTAGLDSKMAAVDVMPISAPSGTRIARVAVQVRDKLLFDVTHGGATPTTKQYRLDVQLAASQTQVIVDVTTNRSDVQTYGLEANYTLTDLNTKRPVVQSSTFARVSYDTPGQQQRFAGERGLRDAENRAADTIAENIRNRLASYFVAGT